ncbi:hypothetical protein YT1_p10169 (plasmid) [Rhodococcus ruber]|nr:hypothetical protein YT1_p10169 [Rhodococcus ruber]
MNSSLCGVIALPLILCTERALIGVLVRHTTSSTAPGPGRSCPGSGDVSRSILSGRHPSRCLLNCCAASLLARGATRDSMRVGRRSHRRNDDQRENEDPADAGHHCPARVAVSAIRPVRTEDRAQDSERVEREQHHHSIPLPRRVCQVRPPSRRPDVDTPGRRQPRRLHPCTCGRTRIGSWQLLGRCCSYRASRAHGGVRCTSPRCPRRQSRSGTAALPRAWPRPRRSPSAREL